MCAYADDNSLEKRHLKIQVRAATPGELRKWTLLFLFQCDCCIVQYKLKADLLQGE